MAQNVPEKKMPLTAANATMCLAKLAVVVSHHLRAHCAFGVTSFNFVIAASFVGLTTSLTC